MLVCFVSILRTVRAPLPPPGGEAGGHSVPAVAPAQTARWRQRLDVLGVVAVEGAVHVVLACAEGGQRGVRAGSEGGKP
eukprot:5099087-Pyramimonas_sp.AAC.1